MTEEKKEFLIAKMLDSPSSLSDEEMDVILHDDELKDIYEMSSAVSGACIRQSEIDMAEEWERFRPRIRRKPSAMRWVMRVAAIFLGVVVASGIVVKLTDYLLSSEEQPVIAKVEERDVVTPDSISIPVAANEPVMKVEEALPVGNQMAHKRHRAKAAVVAADTITAYDLDDDEYIEQYLRVQQARIDNELAMMTAQEIREKYATVIRMLDLVGVSDTPTIIAINKLTIP